MDEELVRWKTGFERTVANEFGDANKQRSLFPKTPIAVRLLTANGHVTAVKRDDKRHTQRARQRKSCAASAREVSMHQLRK